MAVLGLDAVEANNASLPVCGPLLGELQRGRVRVSHSTYWNWGLSWSGRILAATSKVAGAPVGSAMTGVAFPGAAPRFVPFCGRIAALVVAISASVAHLCMRVLKAKWARLPT